MKSIVFLSSTRRITWSAYILNIHDLLNDPPTYMTKQDEVIICKKRINRLVFDKRINKSGRTTSEEKRILTVPSKFVQGVI